MMYAHGGAHIRSVPLREFSFMRAPSGPLIPFGDVGTLWAPTLKNKSSYISAPSNQEPKYVGGEGGRREVGGR